MLAMSEMYVKGVSTRKMAAITEKLCGTAVSSPQVSRAAAMLDDVLEAWRKRPLGEVKVLYLDARYEKVRLDGQIRDAAILIASGVGQSRKRQILSVSVSLSEAEVYWRAFLEDLVVRGMQGIQLIVSDDHSGLRAGASVSVGRRAMAAMSISPAAEYAPLYSPQIDAQGGGRRYSHDLQRT